MAKPKPYKRIVFGADPHCGHRVGLTPPLYQSAFKEKKSAKYLKIRKECWNFIGDEVEKLKPIDLLALAGDLIEGPGGRSGGTELLTTSIKEQRDISVEAIRFFEARNIIISRGTAYHVSPDGQDAEDDIAEILGAKIGDHEFFDVNGVTFDMKHHLGGTSIPHGKSTAISKEQLWNLIWADYDAQKRADVVLRAHNHYYSYNGDDTWLGINLPALQAMGSKYGARRCSNLVKFGFVHFDVFEDGSFTWMPHILRVKSQAATVTRY
uniref:Calcineurin-like phosphoesterase n=1 Tax=viral metagenome TaxID=1070528 RepID=A0A6M3XVY7_9ZZZZ